MSKWIRHFTWKVRIIYSLNTLNEQDWAASFASSLVQLHQPLPSITPGPSPQQGNTDRHSAEKHEAPKPQFLWKGRDELEKQTHTPWRGGPQDELSVICSVWFPVSGYIGQLARSWPNAVLLINSLANHSQVTQRKRWGRKDALTGELIKTGFQLFNRSTQTPEMGSDFRSSPLTELKSIL